VPQVNLDQARSRPAATHYRVRRGEVGLRVRRPAPRTSRGSAIRWWPGHCCIDRGQAILTQDLPSAGARDVPEEQPTCPIHHPKVSAANLPSALRPQWTYCPWPCPAIGVPHRPTSSRRTVQARRVAGRVPRRGKPWPPNPRVRGSSPWRRTRSDQDFHRPGLLFVGRTGAVLGQRGVAGFPALTVVLAWWAAVERGRCMIQLTRVLAPHMPGAGAATRSDAGPPVTTVRATWRRFRRRRLR
jgi:hypothetical protein